MKNTLSFIVLFIVIQFGFSQKPKQEEVSKKLELDLFHIPEKNTLAKNKIIYKVEADLQTISAYENRKLKWQTNIIKVCGKPSVGKAKITGLNIIGERMSVVFGKHSYADVDIKDGKTTFLGSD